MKISSLIRGVYQGRSLLRIYQGELIARIKLSGEGIDLGAKSMCASYYEHINLNGVDNIEFVDYFRDGKGIVKMDLETPFPINTQRYDFVLAINVLEHLFNFSNFADESFRILRKGGEMHIMVPFFMYYHPDPNDYFRYTQESLHRIMIDAGFDVVSISPVAAGPFKVAVSQIANFFKYKWIVSIIYMFGLMMDKVISKIAKKKEGFPLGYYVCCKKAFKEDIRE